MNEYPIEIIDNHIIALIDDNRILLDTGAPNSISDGSSLSLLGNNYNFSRNFMGFTINQLNDSLTTEINLLLGGDVLRNLNFFVDWDMKKLLFSSKPFEYEGTYIPLDFFMNIPIVDLQIDGSTLRAFLDTGAKVSYLNPDLTYNYNLLGTTSDFYPGFGEFDTKIYEVPVKLGTQTFTIIAGHLPNLLQMTLMMANTRGILGNDIFKYFNLCFNLRVGTLILIKRNGSTT
ncbi:MAG: hypothetical protein KatS3mg036_1097 [Ignavibacterium sp.]|nr:MAG: hypothetical protein KatS3mg036_1097 [Ignavibacterium sp.]